MTNICCCDQLLLSFYHLGPLDMFIRGESFGLCRMQCLDIISAVEFTRSRYRTLWTHIRQAKNQNLGWLSPSQKKVLLLNAAKLVRTGAAEISGGRMAYDGFELAPPPGFSAGPPSWLRASHLTSGPYHLAPGRDWRYVFAFILGNPV